MSQRRSACQRWSVRRLGVWAVQAWHACVVADRWVAHPGIAGFESAAEVACHTPISVRTKSLPLRFV